jgi:DNA-binding response OmpR family regulator
MNRRILIVEDDEAITLLVRDNLRHAGFDVECVRNGHAVLSRLRSFAPDLVLLDLMLPGLDGFEICRAISEASTRTPVIIMSARSQDADKIRGLQLGADDYITKPFALDELLARIHAVLRRSASAPERLELGEVRIDFSALRATKGKKVIALSDREFDVLRLLSLHRDRVVSREQLLRSVWGYSELPLTRTVDHFIARLRAKIEDNPRRPRYLHTVYGEGYRLIVSGER